MSNKKETGQGINLALWIVYFNILFKRHQDNLPLSLCNDSYFKIISSALSSAKTSTTVSSANAPVPPSTNPDATSLSAM